MNCQQMSLFLWVYVMEWSSRIFDAEHLVLLRSMHYRLKKNILWILEIVKARRNLIVDADMQKHLRWAVTFMKSCYWVIFGMKRQFNIACVFFEKDKMLIVKQAHSRPSYEICLTFCFLSITKIFSLKTFATIKRNKKR